MNTAPPWPLAISWGMSELDTALDANQSRTCFLEIKKEIKTIRRGQLPFRFYANRSFVMNVISICGPKTNKTESELVMREFSSYKVSRWVAGGKCSLANIYRIWEYTRASRGCNSARHTFAIVARYWMEIRQREHRTIARTDDMMITVIRYKDIRTGWPTQMITICRAICQWTDVSDSWSGSWWSWWQIRSDSGLGSTVTWPTPGHWRWAVITPGQLTSDCDPGLVIIMRPITRSGLTRA